MARIAGNDANFSYNSVAIEDELNNIGLTVDNTLTEVTAFADTGAEFVEGLHNGKFSISGASDFAASQGDATIFGQIGSGEAAFVFQPTGNSAGANDPNYTGNALVSSYSITCEVGGAATYSAELQVNGAVSRAVA
ncbi:MAG: phage tail tube protein [Halobacteriota archaeon]|nr:phage tail tube protein [Halobacteriota archaeon]